MPNSRSVALDLDALLAAIGLAEKAKTDGTPWEYRIELETQAERAILSAAPALIEIAKLSRNVASPPT
jgi:hypothetical protein